MSLALMSLLVLGTGFAQVDVWKQNIEVGQLATLLSKGDVKFACNHQIAHRRVHVFARRQVPLTVARMTALTMGFKLTGQGSTWRFEPDPHYERLTAGHNADVRNQAIRALDRLVSQLKKTPPRVAKKRRQDDVTWTARLEGSRPSSRDPHALALYGAMDSHRDDILWMLTNLPPDQRKSLLSGHSVIGAVPKRPGCVPLPGSSTDYRYLNGAKQAYLILDLDYSRATLKATPVKLPLGKTFPDASSDDFPILRSGGGVFSFGQEWSKLGTWATQWNKPDRFDVTMTGQTWKPANSSHGAAAENLAVIARKPTIVEASPRKGRRPWDRNELAAASRQEGGWLLVKPPVFWDLDKAWKLPAILKASGKPPVHDARLALDWLAKQSLRIPEIHRQYLHATKEMREDRDGLGYWVKFSTLWNSLSPQEKSNAMSVGLSRSSLNKAKQALFTDSACQLISHCGVRGDISGILESGKKAALVVRSKPLWSLKSENGSAGYPSKALFMDALSRGTKGLAHLGMYYTIRFSSGSGFTEVDTEVYTPFKP